MVVNLSRQIYEEHLIRLTTIFHWFVHIILIPDKVVWNFLRAIRQLKICVEIDDPIKSSILNKVYRSVRNWEELQVKSIWTVYTYSEKVKILSSLSTLPFLVKHDTGTLRNRWEVNLLEIVNRFNYPSNYKQIKKTLRIIPLQFFYSSTFIDWVSPILLQFSVVHEVPKISVL